MKKVFKKNQLIITALALMIAVAGYLSLPTRMAKMKSGNGGFCGYGRFIL